MKTYKSFVQIPSVVLLFLIVTLAGRVLCSGDTQDPNTEFREYLRKERERLKVGLSFEKIINVLDYRTAVLPQEFSNREVFEMAMQTNYPAHLERIMEVEISAAVARYCLHCVPKCGSDDREMIEKLDDNSLKVRLCDQIVELKSAMHDRSLPDEEEVSQVREIWETIGVLLSEHCESDSNCNVDNKIFKTSKEMIGSLLPSIEQYVANEITYEELVAFYKRFLEDWHPSKG